MPDLVTDDCGVTATFSNGEADWFDLAVDAGEACFGSEDETFPALDDEMPRWAVVSSLVEAASSCAVSMDLGTRSIRLHPLQDSRSAVSFAWRHTRGTSWPELFADLGWLVPELLSRVDGEPCRVVRRVRDDRWVRGHVVVTGDAAWDLGPHAERGVSLALGGAELLGDALDIFPDADEALRWWERTLRPFIRRAQARTRGFGDREAMWGSPSTRSESWTRSNSG